MTIKVWDNQQKDLGWSWEIPAGISVGLGGNFPEDQNITTTLHPGDSWTIAFSARTFRPFPLDRWVQWKTSTGTQTSAFNLKYVLQNGKTHFQSVPVTLTILASTLEIYVAAFIGGIIGSLVNTLTFGWGTLVSGVLGLFLVLIAQRGSDVRIGVSIEDATGGLVVGFLVGYLGTSYFKGFLPKP